MDTILFFQKLDSSPGRRRLEGLSRFAREVGWNIQCQSDLLTKESLQEMIDFWRPVGAILSTNDGHTEYESHLFSPESTVLLDCYPPGIERFPIVTTDSAAAAELAVRELLGTGCTTYGFVPWSSPRLWSENRRQQFKRLVGKYGHVAHEFTPDPEGGSISDLQMALVAWLRTLPKPIGLFAANDLMAMNVLNACHIAKIVVPFECRIVSVDDDEIICSGTNPTLSSVGLDFMTAGYRAGELLYKLLHNRQIEQQLISIPPIGLTRRGSSRVFLQSDRYVLRAAEMIQAKACSGLEARDVLPVFPCSRRLAEIRFRKATGHSVLEAIRSVRIEHAKHLLRNPFQRLDAVAEQCGYESDTTFRRIFKEVTGMTLREYQRSASR